MGVVFLSAVGLEMFTADNVVSGEIFTPSSYTEISSVIGCRTSHTTEKSTFASLGFLGALNGACGTLMEGADKGFVAVRLGVHQFIEAVLVVKLAT